MFLPKFENIISTASGTFLFATAIQDWMLREHLPLQTYNSHFCSRESNASPNQPTLCFKLNREPSSTSPPLLRAAPSVPETCWGASCSSAAVQTPGSRTPAWWRWRCRWDPDGGCSYSGPVPGEVSLLLASSSPGGALLPDALALLAGHHICSVENSNRIIYFTGLSKAQVVKPIFK